MNLKTKLVATALISTFVTVAPMTYANDSAHAAQLTRSLRSVPAPELPAKAAAMVKQSNPKEIATAASDVTRAACKLNPAAAPTVVGTIAKETPEVAPVAAGAAAALQPKMAVSIARAAAAGAPAQAGKIVKAVCKEVPQEYRGVAVAVAQVVPSAGKEILQAIAEAVPSLKSYIENSQLNPSPGAIVPVATILKEGPVPQTPDAGPTVKPPPQIGPPFTPLGGTPGEINPGQNDPVPPGGRDYAAP